MYNLPILLPKLVFFFFVVQFYLPSPWSEVWEGWSFWGFFHLNFLQNTAIYGCLLLFQCCYKKTMGPPSLHNVSWESPDPSLLAQTRSLSSNMLNAHHPKRGSREFSIRHCFTKFYYFNANNKCFRCLILWNAVLNQQEFLVIECK